MVGAKGVTGYESCFYCYAKGEKNDMPARDEDGRKLRKGGAVLWTAESMGQPKRTHNDILADGQKALENGVPERGIKSVSCLTTDLVDDVTTQVPVDFFHAAYAGMAKKLLQEVLKPSMGKAIHSEFNQRYKKIQVPSEVQRRPRPVEFSSFKCTEYKNVALFGFPILTSVLITNGRPEAAKVFQLFSYLLKAMLLDDESYRHLKTEEDLNALMAEFYKLYEKTFGSAACVPNVHMFYHLLEQRERDSLQTTSTEDFETYYGVIRQSYKPCTVSPGKQVLSNAILRHNGKADHACCKSARLRPKEKDIKDDSWLLTKKGFVRITKRLTSGQNKCAKAMTTKYTTSVKELKFEELGVVRMTRLLDEKIIINKDEIISKAVNCENILISVPWDGLYG